MSTAHVNSDRLYASLPRVTDRTSQQVAELRERLHIRRQDGFLLSSETLPLLWRREETVFILKREIEAAARLASHEDFDVKSFDAFCHCLEYSDFILHRTPSGSAAKPSALESCQQFDALCDWLLDTCRELLEPPLLVQQREARAAAAAVGARPGGEFADAGRELWDDPGFDARERFKFLRRRVLRARIWADRGQNMFRRLQAIACEFMDKIAPLCDSRFEALCAEPGGRELLAFGLEAVGLAAAAGLSAPTASKATLHAAGDGQRGAIEGSASR